MFVVYPSTPVPSFIERHCTYSAENPEPCEGQQLTSTIVVIDHDITTPAVGVAAPYVGQTKGADNALRQVLIVKGRPLDLDVRRHMRPPYPCDRQPGSQRAPSATYWPDPTGGL
ncbi:hypothetical protein LA080_006290 [Diaporthe eres]|nr:hypothetical protein LA080_006290 [Diaporthe eres]